MLRWGVPAAITVEAALAVLRLVMPDSVSAEWSPVGSAFRLFLWAAGGFFYGRWRWWRAQDKARHSRT